MTSDLDGCGYGAHQWLNMQAFSNRCGSVLMQSQQLDSIGDSVGTIKNGWFDRLYGFLWAIEQGDDSVSSGESAGNPALN